MQQAEQKMVEALKQDRATRFGAVPDAQLRVENRRYF